jgi:hypothetical protein
MAYPSCQHIYQLQNNKNTLFPLSIIRLKHCHVGRLYLNQKRLYIMTMGQFGNLSSLIHYHSSHDSNLNVVTTQGILCIIRIVQFGNHSSLIHCHSPHDSNLNVANAQEVSFYKGSTPTQKHQFEYMPKCNLKYS